MRCNNCNHKISNSSIFCNFCGDPIDRSNIPPKKKTNKKNIFSIISWCLASVCSLLIIFNAIWCIFCPLSSLPVFDTIIDSAIDIAEDNIESINKNLNANERLVTINGDGEFVSMDEYIKDINRTINRNSILEVSSEADLEILSSIFYILTACICFLWLLALVMTILSVALKKVGMAIIALITTLVTSLAFSGMVFAIIYAVLFITIITFLIIIKVMNRQYNKETVTE